MNLGIGLSALRASQFAINNTSHNIANAGTEGYHRRSVELETAQYDVVNGRYVGSGVNISDVQRYRDSILESAFTNSTSDLSRVEQNLSIETRIESLLLPGEGSIQNGLSNLFDDLGRLSANPNEPTLRNAVLTQANNVATRIQEADSQFADISTDVKRQLDLEVEALNQDIDALVSLQNTIAGLGDRSAPNDLLDQRDQLINSVSERIDIQRHEGVQNGLGLTIAGSSISIGIESIRFETVTDETGQVEVHLQGNSQKTTFAGGKISALVEINNGLVGDFSSKIEEMAQTLIQQFDQIHGQGIGSSGAFTTLKTTRKVDDVDAVLADSAAFPIESGELFFSITDSDGQRRTNSISIDPDTDSLRDVATKISGLDNIQAVVDENTGVMTIIAATGHKFDFTGRLETEPDLTSFSGDAAVKISGQYNGTESQPVTITALGSGQIGKTDGLAIQVADHLGNVINEFNVGDGYEAGSTIDLGDGVEISLGIGEINSGDTFEVVRAAKSDTSGVLSSLGLNSFFTGTDATSIAVNQSILDDPNRLATSKTGLIADSQNLALMIELREQRVLDDGQVVFEEFLLEANAEIGFRVQSSQSVQTSLIDLQFQYETERDSISGVDINEEMVGLAQYQKQYEAAIQIVRTMESMLDDLFNII